MTARPGFERIVANVYLGKAGSVAARDVGWIGSVSSLDGPVVRILTTGIAHDAHTGGVTQGLEVSLLRPHPISLYREINLPPIASVLHFLVLIN